jgi:hypothetical protein
MKQAKQPAGRAGKTEKVSISLDRADLALLRRRAKRLHGGNLSAAMADGIRLLQEQEGREALVAWLGKAAEMTEAEREEIRAEWRGAEPSRRRRSA